MDRALYIAMTGAKHNMLAQTNHSNNLANVNTHGFRADFAQARSMPIYHGDGHPTRAYALAENPATDFTNGTLEETGRDLDIAIEGDGFIAVQAPDGTEAYVRTASLQIDADGMLFAGQHPVLGNGGPIILPPAKSMEIGFDGTISLIAAGDASSNLTQVDRIRMVNPDVNELDKFEDGLIRLREGGEADEDLNVRMISGFLETSNVNMMSEFTDILSLSRQYEVQVKMMKAVEENHQSSARLLQLQG